MNKKVMAMGIVVVLLVCAVGVALMYTNKSSNNGSSNDFTSADLQNMTWGDVLSNARGQTVNFYFWGGSTNINNYVDNQVSAEAAKYDIKINRVPVTDATTFVNLIASEKQAGKNSGGSVDLIWVNGENFQALKQGNLLFGPWADELPNSVLVNWNDSSIAYDMGNAVNYYESPWGTAQYEMVYDSAKYDVSSLPHSFAELKSWVIAHPGQFTYCAPPAFMGTSFIKEALYELTGGYQQYMDSTNLTESQFENKSTPLYDYLSSIEPYLWNEGKTYPSDIAPLNTLFSNGEVAMSMTFGAGIQAMIANGQLPATAKVYCMNTSVANTNYLAIPFNANAKAASMVVANLLLEPEQQALWVNLSGQGPGINVNALSGWRATDMNNVIDSQPAGTFVPAAQLASTRAPDLSGNIITYLEKYWDKRIGSV
jgi:putative spermidine/putrescine transport system substrate-binding protein